ncbi:MAG: ABC transporter permease [Acidobacteriota bacterium]
MLANLVRLWRHRTLIGSLVMRELKARYRGSFLGYFWSFLNPMMQLGVYTLVFTKYMPARTETVPTATYALFLFCGILPWTWFASSLLEASDVIIEHGNLIRKLLFPAEVLPLVRVLANMVHFLFGLPILLATFLVYHALQLAPPVTPYVMLFPVIVALQLLLTSGAALGLAALSVHFRDLKNILGNLLTMVFFASAILYPFDEALEKTGKWGFVLKWNPVAHLMVAYQHVLYFGYPLGLRPLAATATVSVGSFVAGYFIFDRLRDSFADEV